MTPRDRIAEIRAALAAMTFDRFGHEDAWSVDPHGDGWALMLGSGRGMHGLNMVHLTEPSYQWPVVGRYMLAAMNGAPTLLAALDERDRETERLRAERKQLDHDWDVAEKLRRDAYARELAARHNLEAQVTAMKLAALAAHEAVWRAMNASDAEALAALRDDGYVHQAIHKIIAVETESVTAMDAWREHVENQDRRIERLEAEIERLRAENTRLAEGTRRAVQVAMMRADADTVADIRDAAFRAGAEATREACAVEAEQHDAEAEPFIKGGVLRILARDIRALPLPEPKR